VYTLEFCVYNIIYEGVEMAFQNYLVIQAWNAWGMMSSYCKGNYYSAGLQELSFLRSASAFTFEVMSIVKQTYKHCWIFFLLPFALYRYTLSDKNPSVGNFLSHVAYSCHHNSRRFTFLIFEHSWLFSLFHSWL
jgi:hypothetical protein